MVTGAAGSGTTTVGRSVAAATGASFFDADDYFWLPTVTPFMHQRDVDRRLSFILEDLDKVFSAVIAGSIVDWGARAGWRAAAWRNMSVGCPQEPAQFCESMAMFQSLNQLHGFSGRCLLLRDMLCCR